MNEDDSQRFADLVAEALDVRKVFLIDREALRTATPTGISGDNPFGPVRERILLVDDGINSGVTMDALITFCRSCKVFPMGALVFDNRLSNQELRPLEAKLSGQRIVALYTWSVPPVTTLA